MNRSSPSWVNQWLLPSDWNREAVSQLPSLGLSQGWRLSREWGGIRDWCRGLGFRAQRRWHTLRGWEENGRVWPFTVFIIPFLPHHSQLYSWLRIHSPPPPLPVGTALPVLSPGVAPEDCLLLVPLFPLLSNSSPVTPCSSQPEYFVLHSCLITGFCIPNVSPCPTPALPVLISDHNPAKVLHPQEIR